MDIEKAVKHNIFGGFCSKSNMYEKALTHFLKALELTPPDIPFSNVHVNLGTTYNELKRNAEAKFHYEKAIETFPSSPAGELQEKLNSKVALSEAYSNLAVFYMNEDNLEHAHFLIRKAIEIRPDSEAHINLGNLLRETGKRQDAIEHAWTGIEEFAKQGGCDFTRPLPIDCARLELPDGHIGGGVLHVVCVKWGTKYPPDYVNKLYSGVRRYLTEVPYDFTCFTEDSAGLDEGIAVVPLAEDWSGWWGKATLFSETGLEGRLLYIDLDTVITGSLNDLARYSGMYAVMGTGDLQCEKAKNGYNTSIIAWHSSFGRQIYSTLKECYSFALKFICRFDHWTEMNVVNADIVQDVFPGQFLDYLTYCQGSVPEDCRMVCFPRDPKPHDYSSDWIREWWIN